MLAAYTVIVTVILIVTWPCGTILNSSIIAVYLSDWKKGVKCGECDQITLSMGCNYLLIQCFIIIFWAFRFYGLDLPFAEKLTFAINTGFWFSVPLSFWLTADLSICYCLRLVNLSSALFNQIKRRLSRIVTPLLLWSVGISFIFPVTRIFAIQIDQNETFINLENTSNVNLGIVIPAVAFNVCLPFIITSICIVLSLISLLRHIRRMKQNTQFGSPQLKNLIRACRTMFLLMALNFIFSLIICSSMLISDRMGTVWGKGALLGNMLNPSCQAIVLIFGNSKLLGAWIKTLFPQ
uniref:Taste receptor type 2 n=1 Tax=Xenopus tropicalis TaxID=8364 RepID=Q2AB33_XENTR|nr:bitter taste receptor 54 [Xenopus tropicalis]BAE80434.1 bitter taste receptor [Xenopus tropicalis]|eukprot:NP_001165508.1 bitter taste receptor 54 [Xenopus tropicalis]